MRDVRAVVAASLLAACVVAAALVAPACSSDGGDTTTSTSGTAATTESPTSTEPGTTTTLGPPPAAGTVPFVTFPASPADGVSPAGSGCTPQSTVLPDGTWFGILEAVDPAAGTIGLDLACAFAGDAADAAATADGSTEIPVPNDVYVRNQNPRVYTERAVSDVAVGLLANDGGSADLEPTRSGLAAATSLLHRPVWIEVASGWVIAIQQQYFP